MMEFCQHALLSLKRTLDYIAAYSSPCSVLYIEWNFCLATNLNSLDPLSPWFIALVLNVLNFYLGERCASQNIKRTVKACSLRSLNQERLVTGLTHLCCTVPFTLRTKYRLCIGCHNWDLSASNLQGLLGSWDHSTIIPTVCNGIWSRRNWSQTTRKSFDAPNQGLWLYTAVYLNCDELLTVLFHPRYHESR